MALLIKRALKKALKLRLSLSAPSGAGKTYTSLRVAFGLIGIDTAKLDLKTIDRSAQAKVLLVDTESKSAAKYADQFPPFDVIELEDFAPENYIEAIEMAESNGYEVVILDSLTHEWNGKGGVLEIVDKVAARSNGNSTAGWKVATPRHDALFRKIIEAKVHVIGCFRAKQQIAVDRDASGKAKVTKLGMTAIAREGSEFEFDVTGDIQIEGNKLVINKTRCSALAGEVIEKPGYKFARVLAEWLGSDEAATAAVQAAADAAKAEGAAGAGTTTATQTTDTQNAVDEARKKLVADAKAVIGEHDEHANELFRAGENPWLSKDQVWTNLSDKKLQWIVTNKAKIQTKLAEMATAHAGATAKTETTNVPAKETATQTATPSGEKLAA